MAHRRANLTGFKPYSENLACHFCLPEHIGTHSFECVSATVKHTFDYESRPADLYIKKPGGQVKCMARSSLIAGKFGHS